MICHKCGHPIDSGQAYSKTKNEHLGCPSSRVIARRLLWERARKLLPKLS